MKPEPETGLLLLRDESSSAIVIEVAMQSDEFRHHGHALIDWIADYLDNSARYPVMSASRPRTISRVPELSPARTMLI